MNEAWCTANAILQKYTFFPFCIFFSQGNFFIRLPQEIPLIAIIEYTAVFYVWCILELFLRIDKKLNATNSTTEEYIPSKMPSALRETLYILFFVLIYVFMVALSFLLQEFDLNLNLTFLMVLLTFVFLTGSGVSFFALVPIFKQRNEKGMKGSILTKWF